MKSKNFLFVHSYLCFMSWKCVVSYFTQYYILQKQKTETKTPMTAVTTHGGYPNRGLKARHITRMGKKIIPIPMIRRNLVYHLLSSNWTKLAIISVPFTHTSVASGAGPRHRTGSRSGIAQEHLFSLILQTWNSFCSSQPTQTSNSLQIIQFFHVLHWFHCFVRGCRCVVYVQWTSAS